MVDEHVRHEVIACDEEAGTGERFIMRQILEQEWKKEKVTRLRAIVFTLRANFVDVNYSPHKR